MERAQHRRGRVVGHCLNEGLREQFVRTLIEIRYLFHRFERQFVDTLETVEARGHVFETSLVKAHVVFGLAVRVLAFGDLHAVQPRRKRFDRFQHRCDLRVFLLRDLAAHEDAEMPDALVHQSDDHLPACLDLVGAAVDIRDPVEGLLRRRDVVAHRSEENDRRFDRAQIERCARRAAHFARPQLVADEKIARDPFDLFAVHQVIAAPPALEVEKARRFGVDLVEQRVVLVPETVRRIQVLEVLDEIRAVELAVAEIGRQRGEPRPAEHAARVAHRVVALPSLHAPLQ